MRRPDLHTSPKSTAAAGRLRYTRTMTLALAAASLGVFGCRNKSGENEEASFLGRAKSGASNIFSLSWSKDEADDKDKDKEKDGEKTAKTSPKADLDAKDKVVLTAGEWEEMRGDARKCHAEFAAFKIEGDSAKKAEYAKGQTDCRLSLKKEQDEFADKLIGEAQKMLLEARDKLAQFSLTSALVNGDCIALKTTGERFHYHVENKCLNVVNKKVGNDGEVSGLLGAVSADAMKEGIVSLDCDIGAAHIKLISKHCERAVGTGAGAGKIETGSESAPTKKRAAGSKAPAKAFIDVVPEGAPAETALTDGESQAAKAPATQSAPAPAAPTTPAATKAPTPAK